MSATDKPLVTAADGKIAPQYYNPTTDQYQHVQGKNGGSNVNVIESVLPPGAATDAKLDLILAKLGDVEAEIEAIKSTDGIKKIADGVQLTGSYQRYLTLANAVAVSSTSAQLFNLITHGGLTEDQIRQYKEFKFVLINSLDQALNVTVYTVNKPLGITTFSSGSVIYKESSVLAANNGRLVLQANAGGTGSAIKSVPALRGVHTNLIIEIQSPSAAPTSGSVTIGVEMHG